MNTYTFDFLTESQDFDHNETFVLESDMVQECSHRQKQIEQLKQQLESLEKENRGLKMMLNHVAGVEHVCEDLEVKLAEAVEVIEFYTDTTSWEHFKHDYPGKNWHRSIINDDDCEHVNNDEWCVYGGKRARQFILKLKENRNDM